MAGSYKNIPVPTPTQDPVPSGDIRNHVFAGAKLDEEVSSVTSETYTDRLGRKHQTNYGREVLFNKFLEFLKEEGEEAITAIGWQELGDWSIGLQITNRNQIVNYDGSWYKFLGELPHTIAGDSPENDGGIWSSSNTAGVWANIGDAALRSNLGSGDGFKLIGGAHSFTELRSIEPSFSNQSILLRGSRSGSTTGGGQFYYDAADTVTPDNGCTVIVTSSGARWKRIYTGNINIEWAGAHLDGVNPDDSAFNSALMAAAVGSESGYPCSIIEVPNGKRALITEMHYIRCGDFPITAILGLPDGTGSVFGIKGKFAIGPGAGFYVGQAIRPVFDLDIDNGGVSFLDDFSADDFVLRTECIVHNPTIRIKGNYYPATLWYQKGRTDTTDNTAAFGISQVMGGASQLNSARINANACGRAYYIAGCDAGFGNLDSVWEQYSSYGSEFYRCSDVTLGHYESTVDNNGGGQFILRNCGTVTIGALEAGFGNTRGIKIYDTETVSIASMLLVTGNKTLATSNPLSIGAEIVNSKVLIGNCRPFRSGPSFIVGPGSDVIISQMRAVDSSRIVTMTGTLSDLEYTGAVSTTLPIRFIVLSGQGQYLQRGSTGWPGGGCFMVKSSVYEGELTLDNFNFQACNTYFTDESDMYLVKVDSQYDSFRFNTSNTKYQDNNTNYPIYIANPKNLGVFSGNKVNYAFIRHATSDLWDSASLRGCRESAVAAPTTLSDTTDITYSGIRAVRGVGSVFIAAGNTLKINVNGRNILSVNGGNNGVEAAYNFILYRSDQLTVVKAGSTSGVWRGTEWTYVPNN